MDLFKKKNGETNSRGNGGQWTEGTTPAQGRKRVVVVNKINNERPENILFIFSYFFHNQIMATDITRLAPNKTVLFVCDIQVKFSECLFLDQRVC